MALNPDPLAGMTLNQVMEAAAKDPVIKAIVEERIKWVEAVQKLLPPGGFTIAPKK